MPHEDRYRALELMGSPIALPRRRIYLVYILYLHLLSPIFADLVLGAARPAHFYGVRRSDDSKKFLLLTIVIRVYDQPKHFYDVLFAAVLLRVHLDGEPRLPDGRHP